MERLGVEEVPPERRHGKPVFQLTLWLSSNLTVADFALGAVLLTLGLSWAWIAAALTIGNVLGALLVGVLASYGPEFGLPQMMISRRFFGPRGNLPFSAAQWISTLGWFSVNAIISGYVLEYAFGALPLWAYIAISALLQTAIAVYGYDAIHRAEYILSYVLGAYFVAALLLALSSGTRALPSSGSFSPFAFAVALATTFSYIMSWAPYASDYSRYLPKDTSRARIVLYVTLGGALASAFMEVVGMVMGAATGNYSGLPVVLGQFMSRYGEGAVVLSVIMIFLGALTANVLNIYSNSLSLLSMFGRMRRWTGLLIGATIGLILSVAGGLNFIGYYEGFLYFLDYWISPWIGVMIGAHASGLKDDSIGSRLLIAYLAALLVSVPFMNLGAATSGMIGYVGPVSRMMGGADVSFFISLAAGLLLSLILSRRRA
ncbi:MAG: purine-cytosine permease family protein [Nitrososphaeria archaeon]